MNIEIITSKDLAPYIEECEKALLIGDPVVFHYPDKLIGKSIAGKIWDDSIEEIKELNKNLLSSLRNNANIYAIYIKENNNWCLKYIGQRKTENIRERITQHLINKNEKTGSKLEYVREAVSQGHAIGVRFIKTDRDTLRTFAEEEMISKNKSRLPWNIHG